MRGFAAAEGRCQGSGVYLLFALWNMTTVYFFEALLLGIFGLCPGWLLPGVRWLRRALLLRRPKRLKDAEDLVAEWIHFTLFGIIVPTIKLKVQAFGGIMNSATKKTATALNPMRQRRLPPKARCQRRSQGARLLVYYRNL